MMSKFFMYGSELQELEQLMMLVPFFFAKKRWGADMMASTIVYRAPIEYFHLIEPLDSCVKATMIIF